MGCNGSSKVPRWPASGCWWSRTPARRAVRPRPPSRRSGRQVGPWWASRRWWTGRPAPREAIEAAGVPYRSLLGLADLGLAWPTARDQSPLSRGLVVAHRLARQELLEVRQRRSLAMPGSSNSHARQSRDHVRARGDRGGQLLDAQQRGDDRLADDVGIQLQAQVAFLGGPHGLVVDHRRPVRVGVRADGAELSECAGQLAPDACQLVLGDHAEHDERAVDHVLQRRRRRLGDVPECADNPVGGLFDDGRRERFPGVEVVVQRTLVISARSMISPRPVDA